MAWETGRRNGEWRYLETTMIGAGNYEDARASAEQTARGYKELDRSTTDNQHRLRMWPLRELRTDPVVRITPME